HGEPADVVDASGPDDLVEQRAGEAQVETEPACEPGRSVHVCGEVRSGLLGELEEGSERDLHSVGPEVRAIYGGPSGGFGCHRDESFQSGLYASQPPERVNGGRFLTPSAKKFSRCG